MTNVRSQHSDFFSIRTIQIITVVIVMVSETMIPISLVPTLLSYSLHAAVSSVVCEGSLATQSSVATQSEFHLL